VDPDPEFRSLRAKMTPKKRKKLRSSYFEVLDVVF
jgi:hypothetical protein